MIQDTTMNKKLVLEYLKKTAYDLGNKKPTELSEFDYIAISGTLHFRQWAFNRACRKFGQAVRQLGIEYKKGK